MWIAGWYLFVSLITFAVYGLDKHKARLNQWRIKERTLHLLELIGGWPGALAAQQFFHHKRKKTKFMLVTWAIVALHLSAWAMLFYRWRQ
jgi:uncharacterized membrane protein YsdA (DUF1294 family)